MRHPCCLTYLLIALASRAAGQDTAPVGVQPDGRVIVPTNQVLEPAGRQVTFPGRPVDLTLAEGGKVLVVKNMKGLVFIDPATARVRQTLPSSVGFSVVGLAVHGSRVYVSDARGHLHVAERDADGRYHWGRSVALAGPAAGGPAHHAGLSAPAHGEVWVTSTRGNNVQRVDLAAGTVADVVPVGVAPYAVCRAGPDLLYVSNWGGDPPGPGDPRAPSGGTPARIDARTGVANQGTVSVLTRTGGRWHAVRSVAVGLHPSGLALSPRGRFVYVANANSDTVSVIATGAHAVVETIACRPEARLPFGSGCNAVAVSPDGGTLFVANGTNNCVGIVRLGARSADSAARPAQPESRLAGFLPTGWYPGAVAVSADGRQLFVANIKGQGSLARPRPAGRGRNSHDYLGSVSLIDLPDDVGLAHATATVARNNRLAYSLAGLDLPRPGIRPMPVPERHGEPSPIKHVVYVIKENRTYDQVFGDMKEGNGDPRLLLYGEPVTPNQHALARRFTLFDNFYCSGVLSADGHQWVNEAYVTDYLEKAFGGFTRSYPYEGSDPLAFAPTGFLWDNALAHGRTFRNYGEFVRSAYRPSGASWADVYRDFTDGTRRVRIEARPNVQTLVPHTHPGYPGFPLRTPDVYRAALFLEDLKGYERRGDFPNLVYVFLPNDHTNGTRPGSPTPRAMVADNDLALGRIVEALSKSRFWAEMCVFVVEDDPQDGFDHVDGHRTVALAVSPYTRRGFLDHTNYNQTGMVKTIELMLGLPPMNQLDLSATPLRVCFQPTPNLAPYACEPNRVPLDEMNPPLKQLRGAALHWAKKSLELDLDEADEADEDTFNRILWHAAHPDGTLYPERYAGGGGG